VGELNSAHVEYNHPFVGRLTFDFSMLEALDSHRVRLAVGSCDDEASRRRLDELIRQQRGGEHSSSQNLWTVLRARQLG
jgi:hypothetical protein